MAYLKELDLKWSHTISRSELALTLSQCRGFNFGFGVSSITSSTVCEFGGNSTGENLIVFCSTNGLDGRVRGGGLEIG